MHQKPRHPLDPTSPFKVKDFVLHLPKGIEDPYSEQCRFGIVTRKTPSVVFVQFHSLRGGFCKPRAVAPEELLLLRIAYCSHAPQNRRYYTALEMMP
jgi:hypothetical protein